MKNRNSNHRLRRRARVLFLAGMMSAFALSSWAQDNAPRKKMDPEAREKMKQEKFDQMVSSIPNLTSDQKTKLYTIHNRYRAEAKDRAQKWKEQRKSPEEMENMSQEEKEALIDKKAAARAEMQKQRLAEREEMKEVLTEEQIAHLKESRKQKESKRPKRRGRANHK